MAILKNTLRQKRNTENIFRSFVASKNSHKYKRNCLFNFNIWQKKHPQLFSTTFNKSAALNRLSKWLSMIEILASNQFLWFDSKWGTRKFFFSPSSTISLSPSSFNRHNEVFYCSCCISTDSIMSPAGVDSVMKGALNHKCGDKVTGIRDSRQILNPNVFLGAPELNIKRPRLARVGARRCLACVSLSRRCITLKALAGDNLTLFAWKRRMWWGLEGVVVVIQPSVSLNIGPSVCKQP